MSTLLHDEDTEALAKMRMQACFFNSYVWRKEAGEKEELVTEYLHYKPGPMLGSLTVLF